MDRITENLLGEFSKEHGIDALADEKRFEHLAAYVTIRRHYSKTFDTGDLVTSGGDDTGVDAIAMIVNGVLITDIDIFKEIAEQASHFDVVCVFVQAERSAAFDGRTIGNFGFGVQDFFSDAPTLRRNEEITKAAEIMSAILDQSGRFQKNPVCHLYYVTTGKWNPDDATLEGRRQSEIEDLRNTRLFSDVFFVPIDAEQIHKLYRQSRNAVARQFNFEKKAVIPEIPGVQESYLGYLPANQFLKLITDEDGEMLGGLFYDNVRDWLGLDSVEVNKEIKDCLDSEAQADRFVLMNNGITIIARSLKVSGDRFSIENYSIVNGCQTSHVLYESREDLSDSVMVPVRLIGTQDEDVINDIIHATNRQTAVKAEQFFALEDFPKGLERYFQTFDDQFKLYYERRTNQYDQLSIEKTRIITPANMIRAFASMFLNEPHRATRNYAALRDKVGDTIFAEGHRMEPYYVAAFTLYKLEYLFRSKQLDPKYKPARFHILLATRLLAADEQVPRSNS
ncbi:MAG TPA: AIPR family protein, partial [Pyrinomonadaceae bacterium]|nr:AIPR family protein [Pyrinomonadaceae bacterium]